MMEAKKLKPELHQPNVFEYEDVGSFLNDWFDYLKLAKKVSLRQITKESELSVGYLSMVLSGKRRLTEKALQKLLIHLKLSQQERRFLELLHTVGESESAPTRVEALSEMARLSAYKKANRKEHDTHRYLTKWYYVAIREMVLLPDFQEDPVWIQGRLRGRISLHEVNEAVAFLLDRGLIARGANGRMALPDLDLQCKEGVYKISLGEFHRQVLDMAHRSIHEVARDQRYILGRTVAISKVEFQKAKEIFDEALKKIEALGQSTEAEKEVYHFELASFPMTEKQEKEK
ncbi:MAG: TIGR02147 family protein [Bdellovibrio sp.]